MLDGGILRSFKSKELFIILSFLLAILCISGGSFEDLIPFQTFSVYFEPNDLSVLMRYDTNVKGKYFSYDFQISA